MTPTEALARLDLIRDALTRLEAEAPDASVINFTGSNAGDAPSIHLHDRYDKQIPLDVLNGTRTRRNLESATLSADYDGVHVFAIVDDPLPEGV